MSRNNDKDPKGAVAVAAKPVKGKDDPKAKGKEDPKLKGKEPPKEKPLVPPDDAFWQRYSPNSEFPFSGLASFCIHATVLFVLLAGALVFGSRKDTGEEIEPVLVGDGDGPAGGGGNPLGQGFENPGNLSAPDVTADLLNPDKDKPDPNLLNKPDDVVTKPKSVALDDDPDADKIIEKAKQKMPSSALGPQIRDALTGLAGKGRGGSGRGGGRGSGVGMADGDGSGGNKRGRRVLRWAMILNTGSGKDYVRQLNAMGAFIGLPDKNQNIMLVRNLSERPAKPQLEDMLKIGRVWWTDERQDSAVAIARELQINWIPSYVMAFFPVELEKKLVEKELEYGSRFGRKREEDIEETVFQITFRRGVPQISVQSQVGKK